MCYDLSAWFRFSLSFDIKHVRLLDLKFLFCCSYVSGLGFLGRVCIHMLAAWARIHKVCVCI